MTIVTEQALPDSIQARTTLLDQGSVEDKRAEVLEYFHKTCDLYESLFECLKGDDAYYTRANPLRHPLIFYYGHTAVFYINKLNVAKMIDERVDSSLESSLAIGVDEMSWDDLNDRDYQWPTPAKVKQYRDSMRAIVDGFIRTCKISLPISWEDPLWIVMMGIEHERIHLETSSVLVRELPLEMLTDHPVWSTICRTSAQAPINSLLPVTGGTIK
ncbi:MAG: hypothetical protein ACI8UP_002769, partial [Porticoccaceae bacterium]